MVTSKILHVCSACGKAFNDKADDWFRNDQGLDLHSCPNGEIGQKINTDDEDDDD